MSPVAGAQQPYHERDRDLRCCFSQWHLQNHVVIALDSGKQAIAHLHLLTPEGARLGVDAKDTQYLHTPRRQGVYAMGPRPNKPVISSEWDFSRYLVLLRQWTDAQGRRQFEDLGRPLPANVNASLPAGRYQLSIIAHHDGNFSVTLYANGKNDPSTALRWPLEGSNHIKAGQRHEIIFVVSPAGKIMSE